jgi:NAD(P)H-quinone oxidoreductase subunit 5
VLFDRLTAVMTVLITFLGWAVVRFSQRYLAGEPGQPRYYRWLLLTLSAVLVLVSSGHLLLLAAAWIATSLCLHQLLLQYPHRPGAVFAARKKFLVSRLGDACIAVALFLIWREHGAWELRALFSAANAAPGSFAVPAIWLALGAALKSAQVPFHSWLPDTMETPTPVSAFMHAGVVNAGGFLMIRLQPLLQGATAALALLVILGALTAAFGAVVMLTQPTVKRALAYSTIAQMGFMLLECGLGAFGLAAIHLVAHSIYKAHAFLMAGSTVGAVRRAAAPLKTPALLGGIGVAVLAVGTAVAGFGAAGGPVFSVLLTLTVAYGLARLWSVVWNPRMLLLGLAGAAAWIAVGRGVEFVARHLAPILPPIPALAALAAAILTALFGVQVCLWRASRHAWSRRLYVHVLNGFYLGTLANRILRGLWPAQPPLVSMQGRSPAATPDALPQQA